VTEQGTPKPQVGGSIPSGPASPYLASPSEKSGPPLSTEKAPAHPLRDAAEAFLLTKQLAGCTADTLRTYRWWLERYLETGPEVGALAARTFFARLQARKLSPSRQHQAYRTLRAFFRWCVETEQLRDTPLRGFIMRTPKTLPRVPADEDLRALIRACAGHLEGVRNRALLLVLADAGLRASETLHLLTEDWRPADRALVVRAGKGRKDRIAFVGPTTMRALRRWLGLHPRPAPEAFLFCDRGGRPIKYRHLVMILHRLSRKAGLHEAQRVSPHGLRHFAATSWLRGGAGLDEVRRLLGHESLDTTLRYSRLVGADLARAHRAAGGIERLGLD